MRSSRLEAIFPNLRPTEYQVTSEETTRYNCVAWAAGFNSRCWWPQFSPRYYWPGNIDDQSVEAFVDVFRAMGYEVCHSREFEPGFEKIAIYAQNSLATHTARQLASGKWTSKCGDLEDIAHTLEGLEGPAYGHVDTVMRRHLLADAG